MKNTSDVGDLLRNAGRIRKQIERVQDQLKERVVEGSAGGGLVTALVNGRQELLKVTIDPKAVSEEIEFLEDMIVAAVSQGVKKAKALKSEEINRATGGLGDLSELFF